MDRLHRELAPLAAAAWEEIDREARRTLKSYLAARRVVDFEGPLGWNASAVSCGRVNTIKGRLETGVGARMRQVQPLVELRAAFQLQREELEVLERGGGDPALGAVQEAAKKMALAEDRAVFHGFEGAGIRGIAEAVGDTAVTLSEDYTQYPNSVSAALEHLQDEGVEGPYAVVLGPRCYAGLTGTTVSGYPVFRHVGQLVDGPMIRGQAVDGAVVLSLRGGDFMLSVGSDLSVGYGGHDDTSVSFYIEESFTFRPLGPEAAVWLRYA